MSGRMEVIIANDLDREKVFAEISEHGALSEAWAVVSQEELPLTLTIYPQLNGEPWTFRLDDVIEALQRAKRSLGYE